MAIKCIIFDVGGVIVKRIEHTHDALNKQLGKKVFDRRDALHKKALTGKPMHKKHDHIMNLYSNFHNLVLSCDVGAAKPSPRVFRIALKKLKAKPEECVYIEDRREYLETPRKLGMNAIHFRSATALKKELKKLGVRF